MNRLVWKLLRQHISVGQLAGFFLANLFGMMIVLLSVAKYIQCSGEVYDPEGHGAR